MLKFHIVKEALLATSLIVCITFLISSLPLKNEFLKGLRQDVNGFDIYDMAFVDNNQKGERDTNIVIVEIGNSRDEIASQIQLIQQYQPAVIGIDAFFAEPSDSVSDERLLQAVTVYKNLVFANRLDTTKFNDGGIFGKNVGLKKIDNFFDYKTSSPNSGFINFVGDEYSVIRTYPPFVTIDSIRTPAFSSKILEVYSKKSYEKLYSRTDEEAIINYTGNAPEKYTSITKEELLEYHETNQLSSLFNNKIILLGYFAKYPPFVLQDLHFSPLNKHIAGKSFPDMYGVVIHANILTMLIENKYATLASEKISYLFAFIFTFLFLWYVIYLHSVKSHPSHARILLIQFGIILLIIYLFLQVFNLFLWKVPLSSIVISLVLCIELLGLYKFVASWLNKKTGYVTVFTKKHPV